MPRRPEEEENPALTANRQVGQSSRERTVAQQKGDAAQTKSMATLWKHLNPNEKKFIIVFPKYEYQVEAVKRVLGLNKDGNNRSSKTIRQWVMNHRSRNPFFARAIQLRDDTPDSEVLELFEIDMRCLIAVEVYEMVESKKIPEKEVFSIMKRLADSVKESDYRTTGGSVDNDNIVNFMGNPGG